MYRGWNLVLLFALYGQSLGIWPFSVVASTDIVAPIVELEPLYDPRVKRIAIVGK